MKDACPVHNEDRSAACSLAAGHPGPHEIDGEPDAPPSDDDVQAGGLGMSLEEVLAMGLKQLADAKAEGWREGVEAAAKVCDAEVAHYGPGSWAIGEARHLARAIRALLPPAPSEGGESGKVGG